jgi:protocatechuate 3,4-dioxygenase beta subunit
MYSKLAYTLAAIAVLILVACSGSKGSAVEGKLVDWSGRPVAGIKITATQVRPIAGYEHFEAVSRTDGSFRLSGLFPSSQYVLKPWSEKWTSETEVLVETAPESLTENLPAPLVIQAVFTRSEPALVADIATGGPARAAVEGRLVDWNGRPVAAASVIATQTRPVEGFERFEVPANDDGVFRFGDLLASAEYVLSPSSDKWTSNASVEVQAPLHHGDTTSLPAPLVIQSVVTRSEPALVADIATGQPARAALEGRLVDWNGRPVAGATVIATQAQPIKGFDHFEVPTGDDGSFRFTDLLASSEYVLSPSSDKWFSNASVEVHTPPHHGDTMSLQGPLVVDKAFAKGGGGEVIDLATGQTHFSVSVDGIITDNTTGLQWVIGATRGNGYDAAEEWVKSLELDGGGWRMPTVEELRDLYVKGLGERNRDAVFDAAASAVWADSSPEVQAKEGRWVGQSDAWSFRFSTDGYVQPVGVSHWAEGVILGYLVCARSEQRVKLRMTKGRPRTRKTRQRSSTVVKSGRRARLRQRGGVRRPATMNVLILPPPTQRRTGQSYL